MLPLCFILALLHTAGGTLDVYIDKYEAEDLGLAQPLYFVMNGAKQKESSEPQNRRAVPYSKQAIRLTWESRSEWIYRIQLYSSDETILRKPSARIPPFGIVPKNATSFDVTLLCLQPGRTDFRVVLNVTDLRQLRGVVVSIDRAKECRPPSESREDDVTQKPPKEMPESATSPSDSSNFIFNIAVAAASTLLAIVLIVFIGFQYKKCNEPKVTEAQARAELITLRSLPGDVALGANPKTVLNGNCNDSGYASNVVNHDRVAFRMKTVHIDRRRISLGVTLKEGQICNFCLGKLTHFDADIVSMASRNTQVKSPGLGEDVLVKAIKGAASELDVHHFVTAASKLVLDPHRNVLAVIGISAALTGSPAVVYPFVAEMAILKDMLKKRRQKDSAGAPIQPLSVPQLVYMSAQLARGMNHLARNRIVHGDVATRSCIVTNQLQVMITDGALGSDLFPDEYDVLPSSPDKLPVKWMAAECIAGRTITTESNVWSFGVCIWEIMTHGDIPYEKEPATDLLMHLMEGRRLDQPPACPTQVFSLMGQCWALSPEDRPNFHQLTIALHEFYAALTCFI
eukprot:m.254213 g.254213  ORF g.254213 m.254213 type:complete len:570 (+) comp40380_c1_seq20:247-1956(+)